MSETPSSRPGLVRGLGPFMAMAVVVGCVIGSGVFKKPQAVAALVPDFTMVVVVWTAVGLLAMLGALTLAEIAVLYPRAGGNYVFLREGYGPWAGFLWGWVEFWIIRGASQAALATIFTESFRDILTELTGKKDPFGFWGLSGFWGEKSLTMSIIILLAFVNIRGVRWGGGLQLVVTIVKVGSLVAIMLLPWVLLAMGKEQEPGPTPAEVVASLPKTPAESTSTSVPVNEETIMIRPAITLGGFLSALLAVLFAYHGWMNLAPVAEEIRNPNRNIPLALLGGVLLVIVLYLGANLAYHEVIPMWEMQHIKDTPVATVFTTRLLGNAGGLVVSAAIMFSVFGALNGNLLAGPRLLYAMGEDGLAPRALGAIHPVYRTPALAILVMAGWSALLVLIVALLTRYTNLINPKKSAFDSLTDFAMFGAIIFETLAITTIFIFRRRLPNAERPYRCWGYPVVPLLYMILPALIVGNMFVNPEEQLEALAGAGFILLGAIVYFGFVQRRNRSM